MAFTTIPSAGDFWTGAALAALIDELRPRAAAKTSDQTVNNSATLVNDTQLFVNVSANATYTFTAALRYSTGTTPDLKIAWTFPAGLTLRYDSLIGPTSATLAMFQQDQTTPLAFDGALGYAMLFGVVTVSGTAGVLQLQWAQNVANPSNTIMQTGSYLDLRRIS